MKLQNIINLFWYMIYGEVSEYQVNSLFECFKDIFEFRAWLVRQGFKWRSDGLNFSIKTDTFERPGQVIARGWANCGGFMRLFEAFIKARTGADEYIQFELTAPAKLWGFIPWTRWHYASIFHIGSSWYLQSNIDLMVIAWELNEINIVQLFQEYKNARVIDRWRR